MELSINGEVLQFKYESWWGPMYIYENIMDIENYPERKFNPVKTVCVHTMLYSILPKSSIFFARPGEPGSLSFYGKMTIDKGV